MTRFSGPSNRGARDLIFPLDPQAFYNFRDETNLIFIEMCNPPFQHTN